MSLDQLVDRVWGMTPPRSARQTLHSYMSRLRSVLDSEGGPMLSRHSGGYAIDVDESAVDLHCFRSLTARARNADDGRAAALWQEAMELWQGQPFVDLDSDWLRSLAVALETERLAATLEYNDLLLRRGEHARLLAEIAGTAQAHPFDERVAGQLMLAQYRAGRQCDALAHYQQFAVRLAGEHGSEPGPALRDLYQRILQHDAQLAAPADGSATVPADPSSGTTAEAWHDTARVPHRPAQLPLDVPGFTGRAAELLRLDELSGACAERTVQDVVVLAIHGTAGVGKTALAVHWAHRVADQFPDGQLYVNLRGYDPDQPMRPGDALGRLLTALGVPDREIPVDVDGRAARYRSELAERRMLLVLDNAGSVAQVRPLLPGSGSSRVLITSRDNLAGLVAVHGARRIDVDLLPQDEAAGLLRLLIGPRAEAEPEATETLADQCARLPLALRVAAVLATSRPDRTLSEVAADLADRQERLELLVAGADPYAAVHTVFSWSIQRLPGPVVRTFRYLGLHPGPDLDQHVAAALTGTEPTSARRVLELLVESHLLQRTGPGRYSMHDLLRAYAVRLSAADDTDDDREAAEQRLFAYYRAAAISAMSSLFPAEAFYRPSGDHTNVRIPDLSAPDTATAWLAAERFCVAAIAEHAADTGRSGYVVELARILHCYLGEHQLTDMLMLNGHALRAAEHAGDRVGQAHALRQLGVGYTRLGQYDAAVEHKQRALSLFRQAADPAGEALTLTDLGTDNYHRGRYIEALEDHREAIVVARRAGDRLCEAFALNNEGIVEGRLGDYDRSVELLEASLAISRELGSRYYEGSALNNLGSAELRRERYSTAMGYLHRSLAISDELGSRRRKAYALYTLGMLHVRLGEPGAARECLQEALGHFRRIGERSAQAWSVNGLGEVAQLTGDAAGALSLHTTALAVATEDGCRHQQARAQAGIGHAYRALGDRPSAQAHYERAHVIYTELDAPEAVELRALATETPLAGTSGPLTDG